MAFQIFFHGDSCFSVIEGISIIQLFFHIEIRIPHKAGKQIIEPPVAVRNGQIFIGSKTLGPRTESAPRKGLEEYLEGEDKAMYLALVEKAKANREAANKKAPMTEYEKRVRAVERAQAKLAELQAQQNA